MRIITKSYSGLVSILLWTRGTACWYIHVAHPFFWDIRYYCKQTCSYTLLRGTCSRISTEGLSIFFRILYYEKLKI